MIFSCTQWNWPLNSIYGIEQVLTCVFLFDFVLSPSSYLRLIVSSFFLLHSCCIQFVSFWNCFDSCLHTLLFGIPRTLLSCASQSFFSFRLYFGGWGSVMARYISCHNECWFSLILSRSLMIDSASYEQKKKKGVKSISIFFFTNDKDIRW
jgi:hypothetical protein